MIRLLVWLVLSTVVAMGQGRPGSVAGEGTFTEGMMLFVLEDYAGALKHFEAVVKLDEKSAAGHYMKSRAELALEQDARAELSAATAVQLEPTGVYYLQNYAVILQKNHKNKAAQNIWSELIRQKPDDAESYYKLLELQADAGESKEALKTLELAEKQFGSSEKITRARQLILLKENKVEAALKEGNKVENPEFLLHQAGILINSNRKKEAIRLLEDGLGTLPDPTDAYGLLSELYAGENDRAALRQLMGNVLQDPVLPYALKVNVLGNSLKALGEETEGLEELLRQSETLTEAYPDQPRAYLYAGDISFRLGKPLAARRYYSRSLEADKNQFEVWVALLQIHYRLADLKQLEKDADRATIYFPNQPVFWFYLGWAQANTGKPEDAELAFEDVVRMGGETAFGVGAKAALANPAALEALGRAHADNPYVQYLRIRRAGADRAGEVLKLAAELSVTYPANNLYKLLLARTLVAAKKAEEALHALGYILEAEAALTSDYFEIKGDALALQGKDDEAREAWKKALEADKTNATIRKKLNEI